MDETNLTPDQMRTYQSARHNSENHLYSKVADQLAPVIEAHPFSISANLLYAKALLHQRDFHGANIVVKRLFERYSHDTEVLMFYSQLCYHNGDKKQYKGILERIIQIDSPTDRLYVMLAKSYIYRESKDFKSEYSILRSALEVNPDNYALLSAILHPLISMGRLDEADALSKRLLSEYPDSVDNMIMLADIMVIKGSLTAAESLLEKALLLAPDSLEAGSRLNRIYWRRGEFWKPFNLVKRFFRAGAFR